MEFIFSAIAVFFIGAFVFVMAGYAYVYFKRISRGLTLEERERRDKGIKDELDEI